MRKTQTIETITCDFCNQVVTQDNMAVQTISLLHSSFKDGNNYVKLEVKPYMDYGPTNPDICEKCLYKLLFNHTKSKIKPEKISKRW